MAGVRCGPKRGLTLCDRIAILALVLAPVLADAQDADADFEELAAQFVDEMPRYWPVYATQLGDHRFDFELDRVDVAAREARVVLYRRYLNQLESVELDSLSRANQVDAELLRHEIEAGLWSHDVLQEWAWNPLEYTDLAGSAIYGLLARDFAPIDDRLLRVGSRLAELPRFFREVREALDVARVPRVHAETAARQHAGLMSLVDNLVVPEMAGLLPGVRDRLAVSIGVAREAARQHGEWLENELLPNAAGEFRLGADLYEQKLSFTLNSSLTRRDVSRRAQLEFDAVRDEMYEVARVVYEAKYPFATLPDRPDSELQQVVIRAALEDAYQRLPERDAILDQAIHASDMTRDEALDLMIEGAFQEEREAAGKWTRAQLTSAQLSTYFVGYQEHVDLRNEVERELGEDFVLKAYHDEVLSYGSPAGRYARALVLDLPIL